MARQSLRLAALVAALPQDPKTQIPDEKSKQPLNTINPIAEATAKRPRTMDTNTPDRSHKKQLRVPKTDPPVTATAKRTRTTIPDRTKPRKHTRTEPPLNKAPSTRLKVFVFGSGANGELGLGASKFNKRSPEHASRPRLNHLLASDERGIVQLAVGGMHCAALAADGSVLTWGVNDSKALGRDTAWTEPDELDDDMSDLNPLESTPTSVENLEDIGEVVQVVATDNATFVLTATGHVYGWGTFLGDDGAFGFLKDSIKNQEKPTRDEKFTLTPVRIPELNNIKELAAGANHVVALTHTGNVYSWGSGHQAELGRRVVSRRRFEALNPRLVTLPQNQIAKIFAGCHHSFAIDGKGRVFSWGLNNFGQTGHSSYSVHITTPAIVEKLEGIRIHHIACGLHHTVALTDSGEVLAWGRCDDAQIGVHIDSIPKENIRFDNRGWPRIVTVPTKVPDIDAVFVAAGIDCTFAITKDGNALSWGFSANYRTGLGTEDSVQVPTILKSQQLAGAHISFAGCGGQFSAIGGPEEGN
ncbi:hypothetical protein G7Z17_g7629 [Cylindrodendrum hubeiense]|uniref:RCC1-like domain-containing protein n=1 Tax=Cylindrodendrum hubeiense TaxID=595255 RepID=A0A9P5H6S3_9HYPO|nr:hypothetical protein G7Z17_g7629 [Cylindrodendrum hubeiense]